MHPKEHRTTARMSLRTITVVARLFHPLYALFLFIQPLPVAGFGLQAQHSITQPPVPRATQCIQDSLLQRQESCQYGKCGTKCLVQGAFCCGPAGSLATSPYYCYDPDNPSGTTQSCIDAKPTATCASTDRCYTCSSEQPFCQWETYIQSNTPTLRWFSCVETKRADLTFVAETITQNSPTTPSGTAHFPTGSASTNSTATKHPSLSTGAIVGIGVGSGLALAGIAAMVALLCLKRGKPRPPPLPLPRLDSSVQTQKVEPHPLELDSYQYARSELESPSIHPPRTPWAPFPAEMGADDVEITWRRGSPFHAR
ncbi:hypothetical protein CC80DRAFT_530834 [Byssothecium circinans]|uniref:Mid2 domain-containing protein n=1 Tax=Byssothecium circinans TaxID=147558 RepID=A0A6A5UJ46_9PLEO|nr:hypothetical protein CC80DRAFT_530834 [Byssothecium circinans]